jgi:hypothetical protein
MVKARPRSSRGKEPVAGSRLATRLFELHGERVAENSYLAKAFGTLEEIGDGFTVPGLSAAVGMPPSKGYRVVKRLQAVRIVEDLPGVERPPDWGDYSRGMRKRFYEEHGLRRRGRDPRRYKYSPARALALLRERVQEEIEGIDRRAADEINALLEEYEEIEGALTRRLEEAQEHTLEGRSPA